MSEDNASGITPPSAGPLWGIGARLSIMMALQYGIMGSWWVLISRYLLGTLKYSPTQAACIGSVVAVASLFAPFIARWVDTRARAERFLAGCHLLGGLLVYSYVHIRCYWLFLIVSFFYAMCFVPTLSLTNTIAMRHFPADKFAWVRMWGVVGWIGVAWMVKLCMSVPRIHVPYLFNDLPDGLGLAVMFQLCALFSWGLGLYAFFLPSTPPVETDEPKEYHPLEAFKLLRNPRMANTMIVAFILTTGMSLYFFSTGPFLSHLGVADSAIATRMSVAQWAELFIAALLPLSIMRFGYRFSIALGILAWATRYFIFAATDNLTIITAAIALHGVCYAFYFMASYQYVDLIADPDKRVNAQTLFNVVVIGVGSVFGKQLGGLLFNLFIKTEAVKAGEAQPRFDCVFLIAGVLCMIGLVYFLITFSPPPSKEKESTQSNGNATT